MDAREPSSRLSPSEPSGMMMGPNSYGDGIPNSSIVLPSSPGMMSGMRLSFNPMVSSVTKQVGTSGSSFNGDDMHVMRPYGLFDASEPAKKKRGRPRKYGPDGNMALALSPPLFSAASEYSSEPSGKRRGRPPGSGNKQKFYTLGSAGTAFTPHIITVEAGVDVASKIMAFSQQGPRAVCILTANGAICNVMLRQPATSGGTVTYEGRFDIITLSGSYLLAEGGGTRSRTGGLSVLLAGSDGRVFGGAVCGTLTAANPVQVVVGSFIAEGKKPTAVKTIKREPTLPSLPMLGYVAASASSPPSQGTSSESSDSSGRPINQSTEASNNSSLRMPSSYTSVGWTHAMNPHRHDDMMKIVPNN